MFQYFCSPKNVVVSRKSWYVLICLTNLDKNIRKFKSVISCTSFDLKLNCLQCIAKTKEFTLLFYYIYTYIITITHHDCLLLLLLFNILLLCYSISCTDMSNMYDLELFMREQVGVQGYLTILPQFHSRHPNLTPAKLDTRSAYSTPVNMRVDMISSMIQRIWILFFDKTLNPLTLRYMQAYFYLA